MIGFDSSANLNGLTKENDTFSFNDIFGRPIACGRFYGGYEYGKIIGDADPTSANPEAVESVIANEIFVLPSFSDTGGPIAGRGNRGKFIGTEPKNDTARVSAANLYYALMVNEVLSALRSQGSIIVDGPVAKNPILVGLIAQLRDGQPVYTSSIAEGTTLGAGILAKMKRTGNLPSIPAELSRIQPTDFTGLKDYAAQWRKHVDQDGPK
jgi:glycerol kinase